MTFRQMNNSKKPLPFACLNTRGLELTSFTVWGKHTTIQRTFSHHRNTRRKNGQGQKSEGASLPQMQMTWNVPTRAR